MRIKSIRIINFRNYSSFSSDFSETLNVLVGSNAEGKTNLLEAILFCCVGKSMRNKDKELIRFNQNLSDVRCKFQRLTGESEVSIALSRTENKKIAIDGIPISKVGELLGNTFCVYFSPEELKLVKDAPESRRRFLNLHLSQSSKSYYYSLLRYNGILDQRNKLLKQSIKDMQSSVDIWDRILAKEGAIITLKRYEMVNKLAIEAKLSHSYLTDGKEDLSVSYLSDLPNVVDIEKIYLEKLAQSLEKDIHLGFTTVGPHRDDLKILCSGIDVRLYGSQGQQRTAALSLKLGELALFKEICGEAPILLLDDVLSELDLCRQKALLSFCGNVQTILTTTHIEESLSTVPMKVITIVHQ